MLKGQQNISNQANPRQLIINADDFGMSQEVNRGVLKCYRARTISSATMIVNRPSSAEAASIAKECPKLGVGLHFNLTLGRPISDSSKVSSLVKPDGGFLNSRLLKKRLPCGWIDSNEVSLELQAQFEKLLSFGLDPSHIDSHDHMHTHPVIFNVVADFCRRRNLPMRMPWINAAFVRLPLRIQVTRFIRKVMLQQNWKQWQFKIRSNHSFVGILDLSKAPEEIILQDYVQLLKTAHNNPIELIVHPALIDAKAKNLSAFNRLNKAEMNILSQRAFRKMLQEEGYELVTFSAV